MGKTTILGHSVQLKWEKAKTCHVLFETALIMFKTAIWRLEKTTRDVQTWHFLAADGAANGKGRGKQDRVTPSFLRGMRRKTPAEIVKQLANQSALLRNGIFPHHGADIVITTGRTRFRDSRR